MILRHRIPLLTLMMLAASFGRAQAADPGSITPPGTWTGCYVGANIGYVHGDDDALDEPFQEGAFAGLGASWNTPPAPPYETIGSDADSAIGGGELGCDYQVTSSGIPLVLGAAIDISALDLSGEGTSATSADTHTSFDAHWAATVRGRLGIAPSDTLLLYATGGYAAASIDVRAFDHDTVPNTGLMDVSGGGTQSGWVAGGGGEWRFAERWSMSLEYLHFDFDNVVATGPAGFPAGAFPRFDNDLTFDAVRVGFRFRM